MYPNPSYLEDWVLILFSLTTYSGRWHTSVRLALEQTPFYLEILLFCLTLWIVLALASPVTMPYPSIPWGLCVLWPWLTLAQKRKMAWRNWSKVTLILPQTKEWRSLSGREEKFPNHHQTSLAFYVYIPNVYQMMHRSFHTKAFSRCV